MKKFARILCLLLVAAMLVSVLAGCFGETPKDDENKQQQETPDNNQGNGNENNGNGENTDPQPVEENKNVLTAEAIVPSPAEGFVTPFDGAYVRDEDEDVFEAILGGYEALVEAAKAAETISTRFVLFAKAEAYLLESAVMTPTTTQNGAYTISRVAPRTVPYVQWGNDDDRLFGAVISDQFLTKEERADLLAQWSAAMVGEGTYDPIAYLQSKGHTINTVYNTTFSTAPVTLDWLNTSSAADTEITVNCVDGLVQYNNLNQMMPALAESWTISEDGKTYTFKIREGVYWYTAEGEEYAEVVAEDFVSGFHHMLDAQAGLEWLVDGVVAGAHEYLEGGLFADVGYKATSKYVLEVTLEAPTSYFLTMLTYSCFLPICTSFYAAKGGVYGITEYSDASADTNTYTFGQNTNIASQVYCGPFILTQLDPDSQITVTKNENYYNKANVVLESINWYFDGGENPLQTFQSVIDGFYPGSGLTESTGTLKKAKEEGLFDLYAYISDTTSTTFFGGLNLNRGTFELSSGAAASPKTEKQKWDTDRALQSKSFRQAFLFAFDQAQYNAISRGEDLKYTNLRNMYTHPEFVSLEEDVTYGDKVFPAGTFYGELVQYFLEEMGSPIKVADQIDGWFNLEYAQAALAQAKAELGDEVEWPIQIDIVYYSPSTSQTASAQAFKEIMEGNLGAENVQINLIETTTTADYYACGYRAANGEAGNFDFFQGSGWGPDYGDPSTYLDTFLGYGAGYMTKVIGLF